MRLEEQHKAFVAALEVKPAGAGQGLATSALDRGNTASRQAELAKAHERLQLLTKEEGSLRDHLQRRVLYEKQMQVYHDGVEKLKTNERLLLQYIKKCLTQESALVLGDRGVPQTLCGETGLTYDQAKKLVAPLRRKYPAISRVKKPSEKTGKTPFGYWWEGV